MSKVFLALQANHRMHDVPYIKLVLDLPDKRRNSLGFDKTRKERFKKENNLISLYFDEKKKSNNW